MKYRVFKNWKTSIIGALLLIIAAVALFTGKATLAEFVAFVPFCLGLIYVKDSVFKIK